MSNKSKRNRAAESGRCIQFGPLTVREVGNDIVFESRWDDPSKHAEFLAEWIASKPKVKAGIDEKISRLMQIIASFDPIHLLSFVAFEFAFDKVSQSGEVEPAQDFIAEYSFGLCSAVSFDTPREPPNEPILDEFGGLLRSIFNEVSLYFGIELAAAAAKEKALIDLRVQALLKFLFQRGDTHRYHQYPFIRSLYLGHDQFFRDRFGFGVDDALSNAKQLSTSAQDKLQQQQEIVGKFKQAVELIADAVEDGTVARTQSLEAFRREVQELPEVKKVLPNPTAFADSLRQNPFEIDITSPVQKVILERLAINFGKNREFAQFKKSPGWPTNSGEHTTHPVIQHEGRYYAFVPQMVWRNLREIFDSWIEAADSSYFKEVVFDPKKDIGRSSWLERESVDLLQRLLPGCRVYRNVFYNEQVSASESKRREIDALIEYDRNIIIVSAKSGEWSLAARRGAPNSMAEEIARLVVEGFEQGYAAKQYIENAGNAFFTDDAGAIQITFDATTRPRAIYAVNVTLSALGPAAIQLNALKAAGLLQPNQFAWSVSTNDLRVIADICETPSEFLFYLQRRLRFNLFEQLRGADELDLFAYFLDQGLFFDEARLKGVSLFSVGPNTHDLDRYFTELEKSVPNPAKPKLAISSDFRDLIRTIERTNCHGFSEITLYLLNLDGVYHEKISKNFALLREKVTEDNRCHHTTIAVGEDMGLTIELRGNRAEVDSIDDRYCLLKKYQLKIPTWLFISVAADFQPSKEDRAVIFKGEWTFDSNMEATLQKFRDHKLRVAIASRGEIGRNEQCPCGSGLKYKRCCGR